MSRVDGSLMFDTRMDVSGFNRGTKAITKQVDGLMGTFKKLGTVMVGVFAIKGLTSLTTQAINFASDIQEVQNVVDTAFGDMAYMAEDFASTSIENFGMSKLSAKQFASTYMAMGKGMGIASKEAADMAISTTGRIGDVASFYNKTFAEVDTMMKSIWTGETESLKQIGVVMTETNLAAFALSQGITKNISAMTQAEKTQLRYAFVMNQTKLAAGDFVKTQDSWANQTRILSERWKELLGILGTGLIQVLAPVVKMLNVIMSKLIDFANAFSAATAKLFGKQHKISIGSEVDSKPIEQAAAAEGDLAKATDKATKAAKNNTAAFDELNVLNQDTASSASAAAGGMSLSDVSASEVAVDETGSVEKEVSGFTKKILDLLKPLQDIDLTNLNKALEKLKDALEPFAAVVGAGLEWFYLNVLVPLAKWTIENVLPLFLDILSGAIRILTSILIGFQPLASWLWEYFLKPIAKWTGGVIVSVLGGIADILDRIAGWMESNQTVVAVMNTIVAGFFAAWKIAQLVSFISVSGGVIAMITNLTKALVANTAASLLQKSAFAGAIVEYIRYAGALAGATTKTGMLKAALLHLSGTIKSLALLMVDSVKKMALMTAELVKQAAQAVVSTAKQAAHTTATVAHTVATTAATVATTAFGVAMAILTSPITLVIVAIGALIAIVVLLVKHWDEVKAKAGEVWENIKAVWGEAANWFSETVMEPIKKTFKGGINFLIGLAEGVANAFISAVNAIIKAFNRISFDIPDWVPEIGGRSFGFNLKEYSRIKLPRLATGAVIPPNAEFAAILGDQRNGRNLEAPEGLIRQIVREESGSSNNEIVIRFDGNMAQFVRMLKPYIDKENNRKGGVLIKGVTG